MTWFNAIFWNIQNVYEYKDVLDGEIDAEINPSALAKKAKLSPPQKPTPATTASTMSVDKLRKGSIRTANKLTLGHRYGVARTILNNKIDFAIIVELCVGKNDLKDKGFFLDDAVHFDHFSAMQYLVTLDWFENSLGKAVGGPPSIRNHKNVWSYTNSGVITNNLGVSASTAVDATSAGQIITDTSKRKRKFDVPKAAAHPHFGYAIDDIDHKNSMFEFYHVFFKTDKFTCLAVNETQVWTALKAQGSAAKNPFAVKTWKLKNKTFNNKMENGHMAKIHSLSYSKDVSGSAPKIMDFVERNPGWSVFQETSTKKIFIVIMLHASWGPTKGPGNSAPERQNNRHQAISNVANSAIVKAAEKFNVPVIFSGDFNLDYATTRFRNHDPGFKELLDMGFTAQNNKPIRPTSSVRSTGLSSLKNAYDQIFTHGFKSTKDGAVYDFPGKLFSHTTLGYTQAKRVSDHLPVTVKVEL